MKVPSPGESITEVEIANWLKSDGDYVEKDEEICEVDSDKATLTLNAEESGALKILVKAGETVKVGDVVCKIDTAVKGESKPKAEKKETAQAMVKPVVKEELKAVPVSASSKSSYANGLPSVAAKKLMDENGIPVSKVPGSGVAGRITKEDVLKALSAGFNKEAASGWGGTRDVDSQKMSSLRKKIAQRLVAVKNETAMLTTFNEVDMSNVMALRGKYKDKFKETHGVGLGFMSFFTKAVTEALNLFPTVNAMIDGDEIVYHNYADIGIAVSAPKGLMVPVIRNAEQMSLAEIEGKIGELAKKAREGKISVDEMTGGTFTITNGGVFGSLLSTPIINPPQSAILGMHNIVERPMAVNGQVVIRPMMYIALSYDHRIIDGKESVSFLVKVKEMIENPTKLLFGAKDPVEVLLGL
ncbi:MAG: 2-oxoglutarate dehydrogenase complex dihydrolipoyllysine-residue succinyltransferase [Bacteroidetes bacterium]|nr:2-oxoglutarate dehydrogenase complex dihydrolipoyllysine-residue succinyltransferase [Bacteroidota bacterium]HET6245647.1 2-oxoglutarate dehydrogenase complex dihydrolipoyllysine-residue succinyltransferase [Bacteroidia bacterium]